MGKFKQCGPRMENILEHREKVGVPDAILLEDYRSEDAFIENLRKRYYGNYIYTYIGHVLVSVNPYRNLNIYNDEYLEKYRKVNFYEVPPHTYAIAESAYRSMTAENQDHCILISGESGAGKTEESKHVLLFIAASSGHRRAGDRIRDRLLNSNPVLEAFGNAKTNRNDNSSRFGKYMDIECNFKGDPIGGHIINYLLEKSRVVHQEKGERNFHIFYQLLAGAEDQLLNKLNLTRDPKSYYYLRQGINDSNDIDDKSNYKIVKSALDVIDFNEKEQKAMWNVIGGILHVGNVTFVANDAGHAVVANQDDVQYASQLLQCDEQELTNALTHKTIEAKQDIVKSPINPEQAGYVRDALSKSIYERLFIWLVKRLNKSLQKEERGRSNLIGILDIYGFEIFENNGFEQFCINYCNEKLQQLFIELTLRSEQEEYQREGIQWEQIDYFDNKIICNLVEERHKGIISIMDEECLRPGDATDLTFLAKMDSLLAGHKHYMSYKTIQNNKIRRTITSDEFRLRHYAGDVTYCVNGFLDKNNDLLYRDLKTTMSKSSHSILSEIFPKSELLQLKRPNTASTQFKTSLSRLMAVLMGKEPSYIRCVKPNDFKKAVDFSVERVRHQVQYLGLMENLRVRRAGFAYRRNYEIFLQRYKSMCPSTWPHYKGPAKEGVQTVVNHLKYSEDEYRMGVNKIFIRLPETLFRTEDAFQSRKHELATMIQAIWKGKLQRRRYLKMIEASIVITKNWRRVMARKQMVKRKWAAIVVRKFIHGFITRDEALTGDNEKFQRVVKHNWLLRLAASLPTSFVHHKWPQSPKSCKDASLLLKKMHRTCLVGRYVKGLTPEAKLKFEEKIKAEALFKGKKASYPSSFPHWFRTSRLSSEEENLRKVYFELGTQERTLYSTPCIKFDRRGYKERPRIFVLSVSAIYMFELKEKKLKLKEKYPLSQMKRIVVSPNDDGFIMFEFFAQNEKTDKGDMIMSVGNAIELVTKMVMETGKAEHLFISDSNTLSHAMKKGRKGTIVFQRSGNVPSISKNKEGQLVVAGSQ